MSRVLITGSTDGIGRAAAESLLDAGHEVVVHARTRQRLSAVEDLTARGAFGVVGDLAHLDQVQDVAEQAHRIGSISAVIHNAGVIDGASLLPVNVVAPYVLTALLRGGWSSSAAACTGAGMLTSSARTGPDRRKRPRIRTASC